jgi:hypothetical protein
MTPPATVSGPIIFVGPSAHRLDDRLFTGLHRRPPARRGDVSSVGSAGGQAIILVDGTFHSYPSVGHVELRAALAAGNEVWGLSSMGALRACEMRTLGMRGFGHVYDRYITDPDFADDEVALMHASDPPFLAISEPLIHIRAYLSALQSEHKISAELAEDILARMKNRWFGDRTLPLLGDLLVTLAGRDRHQVRAELISFDKYRLKSIDLAEFLRQRPWTLAQNQVAS